MASREWVTCHYCAGTGQDPYAPTPRASEPRGTATPSKTNTSKNKTKPKPAKADNGDALATFAAACIAGGWTLYFLLGLYSFAEEDQWMPFAGAALAGLFAAALWRLAAQIIVFAGVFVLAWPWLEANADLPEPWMPFAGACAAATAALFAWRIAAVLLLVATGFFLVVVVQDGISPQQVIASANDFIDTVLAMDIWSGLR
ncbi:MAG: hypothetical protein AAGG54_05925 [Pseudomonadota bacterium]